MTSMSADTLFIARELKAAEVPAGQAEAIGAAIGRSNAGSMTSAATKSDLAVVKAEITQGGSRLKARIEQLRSQLVLWFVATNLTLAAIIIAVVKL